MRSSAKITFDDKMNAQNHEIPKRLRHFSFHRKHELTSFSLFSTDFSDLAGVLSNFLLFATIGSTAGQQKDKILSS